MNSERILKERAELYSQTKVEDRLRNYGRQAEELKAKFREYNINMKTVDPKKMKPAARREFELRQIEHQVKSQELKNKLKQKYDAKY